MDTYLFRASYPTWHVLMLFILAPCVVFGLYVASIIVPIVVPMVVDQVVPLVVQAVVGN